MSLELFGRLRLLSQPRDTRFPSQDIRQQHSSRRQMSRRRLMTASLALLRIQS